MTVDEIFSKLAVHMLQGIMFHEEMANYYDFLGLNGYHKCHEYHFLEETCSYRKLCHYYITHFNRLIQRQEPNKQDIAVIPMKWYSHSRQDVDPNLKRESVKKGLQAWVQWETQTKELYESMYTELMVIKQVDAAICIKCMIQDVSCQLKKATQYHLNKKAIDYDIGAIIGQQKQKHEKYKTKIRTIYRD